MRKFINSIGEDNIFIIIAIIVLIIIALVIIIIIEKVSDKKYDLNNYSYKSKKKISVEPVEDKIEEKPIIDNQHTASLEVNSEEQLKPKDVKNISIKHDEEEIQYVTKEQTQEEAKKAIEEAAKKLVYEEKPDIVSPTFFEKVQEEQSIISYEELMKTNVNAIISADKEIDQGNEPITIDEIYEREDEEEKLPVFDENDLSNEEAIDKTYIKQEDGFKPSDVISPVFGVKREIVYQKEYNELGETINVKELEVEIKKTEEFLKELKKLKNKLD